MPVPAANPGMCAVEGATGAGPKDVVAGSGAAVGFGIPMTEGETVTIPPGTTAPVVSISSAVRTLTVAGDDEGTIPSRVIRRATSLVVGYERRYPFTNAEVPDADCCAAGMPSTMT